MKPILTLSIVLLVAALLFVFCLEPYRCNRRIRIADHTTMLALNSNSIYATRVARQNAVSMEACVAHNPTLISAWMLAAANRRILGQSAEAGRLYEQALQHDRRPELFLQLGETYLEQRRIRDAEAMLEQATRFDPQMLDEITDPEVRSRVQARIASAPR